ncbi:hypothetical protein AVEN_174054-1 [Araneus ventricosus]|uniref:Uncharacterized protein n=1 Tax=Araneus ventricosus TaxID=182803 RepID=A0A4Y2C3B7_ARAVE|nr:hypothetical protein AVEN_174054-1 [Araneus ventricosus]
MNVSWCRSRYVWLAGGCLESTGLCDISNIVLTRTGYVWAGSNFSRAKFWDVFSSLALRDRTLKDALFRIWREKSWWLGGRLSVSGPKAVGRLDSAKDFCRVRGPSAWLLGLTSLAYVEWKFGERMLS